MSGADTYVDSIYMDKGKKGYLLKILLQVV